MATLKTKPSISIFLDTRRALAKKGKSLLADNAKATIYPIRLRANFQQMEKGKKKWKHVIFSLEEYCSEADYKGAKSSRARTARQEEIREKLLAAEQKAVTILKGSDVITKEDFQSLFNTSGNLKTVDSVFEIKLAQLKKAKNPPTTLKFYRDTQKAVNGFAPELRFVEITVEWLQNFEEHLSTTCNTTTIGMHMIHLRAVYNVAMKKLKIIHRDRYPFGIEGGYRIKEGEGRSFALTKAEKEKLEQFKTEDPDIRWAVDMWLFSFYCYGLNFADIYALKRSEIINDEIRKKREKSKRGNKSHLVIPIGNARVKEIINKYGALNSDPNAYVFPLYTKAMNDEQKRAALDKLCGKISDAFYTVDEAIGVKEHITCYVARHTFACVSRENGRSIEEISECLGHATLAMTQKYLNRFSTKVKREHSDELVGQLG
jgi:integrase/recombinase XerD